MDVPYLVGGKISPVLLSITCETLIPDESTRVPAKPLLPYNISKQGFMILEGVVYVLCFYLIQLAYIKKA
jgi:hypothetical protein